MNFTNNQEDALRRICLEARRKSESLPNKTFDYDYHPNLFNNMNFLTTSAKIDDVALHRLYRVYIPLNLSDDGYFVALSDMMGAGLQDNNDDPDTLAWLVEHAVVSESYRDYFDDPSSYTVERAKEIFDGLTYLVCRCEPADDSKSTNPDGGGSDSSVPCAEETKRGESETWTWVPEDNTSGHAY